MKSFHFLICILAAFGLFSCSQDEAFVDATPSMGLTAEIPAYQFEKETRVGISENLNTYVWSDGDQIGMYYQDASSKASAEFTILSGGSSSGVFTNSAFSLKPNSTYYAFYPYNGQARVDSYPVDFTGQVQTANGSTDHIGTRNYMSAEVNTDDNGSAFIAFQNLASVIQVVLPIDELGIYTGVTVSSTGNDFITRGTLNMKTGIITPEEMGQSVNLSLGIGIGLNKGDVFTANILVAPTDLSGKELTVTLASRYGEDVIISVAGKVIQCGKAYKLADDSLTEIPYLTFTAEAEQTFTMSKAVETLEYSVNGGSWRTLGTSIVTFGGTYGNLRLRGKSWMGTATNTYSNYSKISFGNSTKVACSGDIRTLVDYENYLTADTSGAKFCSLFENCSSLTSAPVLSATSLADYCYYDMFFGCTSLATAPELPAKTLASGCYNCMFWGCTSLTIAPKLPATNLTLGCYSHMFYDCRSLTIAPELPATTLVSDCYNSMFLNSGIKEMPIHLQNSKMVRTWIERNVGLQGLFAGLPVTDEYLFTILPVNSLGKYYLPATSLSSGCYQYMFRGCSSLHTAPELPATTLTSSCYYSMFSGCSGLTTAPKLPATNLATSCYSEMFMSCFNLTTVPELPATTLAMNCYSDMFSFCINLTTAPELPATTLENYCYARMFEYCRKLSNIKMLATDISATGCLSNWTYNVPSSGIFIKSKDATWDVRGISGIPNGWMVKTDAPAVPFDQNGYGGSADGTGYNNNSIINGNGITW